MSIAADGLIGRAGGHLSPDSPGAVAVLAALAVLLVAGLVLAPGWSTAGYRVWDGPPSARTSAARYLRGLAIALVAGFWAGPWSPVLRSG